MVPSGGLGLWVDSLPPAAAGAALTLYQPRLPQLVNVNLTFPMDDIESLFGVVTHKPIADHWTD